MKQAAILPFLDLLWGEWSKGMVTYSLFSFQNLLGDYADLMLKVSGKQESLVIFKCLKTLL